MNAGRTHDEWQQLAKSRLPKFVFDYVDGGADDEQALARNIAAIRRISLVPDRLSDVRKCSLETTLFGTKLSAPIIIAPTGLNGLLRRDGDLELARSAHRANIPFTLSTASNSSIESVAKATNGEKWFQLYVLDDRRLSERLLYRAMAAEYKVLVLTVDVPMVGNRPREPRNGFGPHLLGQPRAIIDGLLHPRWLLQFFIAGIPKLVNIEDPAGNSNEEMRTALLKRTMDRSLTWHCLEWLRAHWTGPIVLKGILSPRDALKARDCGIDGLVVSNHGGRQLDAFPSSIDVLEPIVAAVGSHMTVMIDSGFRNGSDIIKALALGAKAVMIGRPILYGLAANGEIGATAVLESLKHDIERTLTLIGVNDVNQLKTHHVLMP